MKIELNTDTYNERRYGRPWIAKVDFSKNKKGDFLWGEWIGDHYNGGQGTLILENINPGDIIAEGQKDFRKPRNSAPRFYIVNIDGTITSIGDKGEAYKYFMKSSKDQKKEEIFSKDEIFLIQNWPKEFIKKIKDNPSSFFNILNFK